MPREQVWYHPKQDRLITLLWIGDGTVLMKHEAGVDRFVLNKLIVEAEGWKYIGVL